MHHSKSLFSLIGVFTAALLLGACASDIEPKPQGTGGNGQAQVDPQKFQVLIVNGGESEDFSLISGLESDQDPSIQNQIEMLPAAGGDPQPCKSPAEMVVHDGYVYVVCSLSNEIHVFSQSNLKLEKVLTLKDPAGGQPLSYNPMSLSINAKGTGYVSAFNLNQTLQLDIDLAPSRNSRIKSQVTFDHIRLDLARPSGSQIVGSELWVVLANLTQTWGTGKKSLVAIFDSYDFAKPPQYLELDTYDATKIKAIQGPNGESWVLVSSMGNISENGFDGNGDLIVIDVATKTSIERFPLLGTGGSIAVGSDHIAYIADQSRSQIYRVDLKSKRQLSSVYFGDSIDPQICPGVVKAKYQRVSDLIATPSGILVLEFNSNCALLIDKDTGAMKKQWATGYGPEALIRLN